MMIFYRSPSSDGAGAGPSIPTLRILTGISLLAYPAGALVRLLSPDSSLIGLTFGLGLILLAFAAAVPVLGSRLQRIVGEERGRVDEMEMQLRQRALSWSYLALSALVLVAIGYAGIAADTGWWVPRTYEEWSGLFWGAFLWMMLLPTTFLAWTLDPQAEEEE